MIQIMPRTVTNFVCQQCGYVSPSFLGRCPNCDSWNSFVETVEQDAPSRGGVKAKVDVKPVRLTEVASKATVRTSTGITELDRVLGGGLVPGMAVLIAG